MKRLTITLSYPVDLEAERIFLSAFLTGSYRMDKYHVLSCNDLFASEHRIILYAIMELDVENIRISRDGLIGQLEQTGQISPVVVGALEAVPNDLISEDRMQVVRRRIVDCSIVRNLIHRLKNTTLWLADGDIDSEKFLQWTHDCLIELHDWKEFLPP